MTDEVLMEIRRIKEEFAAKFNHDVDAMFRYLKQCERESGRRYVNLTKKPKKKVTALDQLHNRPGDNR